MLNKSSAEMAATGFSLLLGFAIYAVVNTLVTTFLGPISFLKSVPMIGLLGLLQVTALGLCFRWSKGMEAATPLLVFFGLLSLTLTGAITGTQAGLGLAGWCGFAAAISFLVWLHRLYQKLDRADLLQMESYVAGGFLLFILGSGFLPPSLQGILALVVSLALSGYFAYAFQQLRQEALKVS